MDRNIARKAAIAVVLVALVVAFKLLGLGDFFTLSYIKDSQARFTELYAQYPAAVICSYMAMYIIITSLSIPAGAVMTIAGGALFGFITGTVAVSFASTIGATAACAVSRFILRDWVQVLLGGRVEAVNRGIEKEGALYLFSMRLIPVIPFWAINLVMGLTKMPLMRFFWVSQIGMLAGTMVYVNAGRELAKIESLSVGEILSARLIVAFVLLGIFPIIAKRLMALMKGRLQRPAGPV